MVIDRNIKTFAYEVNKMRLAFSQVLFSEKLYKEEAAGADEEITTINELENVGLNKIEYFQSIKCFSLKYLEVSFN